MKARLIIGLAVASVALAACQYKRSDDFQPYLQNEHQALPEAYPDKVWAYPQGTTPQQIVDKWKEAQIIMDVYDYHDGFGYNWGSHDSQRRYNYSGGTRVDVGPQFYNLPASSQRGLATAISQMYHIDHYLLMDHYRDRAVGVYTPQGLQMY